MIKPEIERAEKHSRSIQSELDEFIRTQDKFEADFRIIDTHARGEVLETLVHLMEKLTENDRQIGVIFRYKLGKFYQYLRRSGMGKMRGCKKIMLADLFWDTRERRKNREIFYWEV